MTSDGLECSTSAAILLSEALPLRRALRPPSLLNLSYHRHRSIVHMRLLISWWNYSRKIGSATLWPVRLADQPMAIRDHHLLTQSVWFSCDPLLQVSLPSVVRPHGLGQVIGSSRQYRLSLADMYVLRCLADFLPRRFLLPC